MARPDRNILKEKLLLLFLLVSILLVGIIWVEGFNDSPPPTPSYYRDTFQVDENIYLTATAETQQYELELTGTPAP